MLLHPDGSEEMLYDCTTCSVVDPFPTFDGESVCAVMWNANPTQRTGGSSIFRISWRPGHSKSWLDPTTGHALRQPDTWAQGLQHRTRSRGWQPDHVHLDAGGLHSPEVPDPERPLPTGGGPTQVPAYQ